MHSRAHPSDALVRVAVIIPHLDRVEMTRVCCESLAQQSGPPAHLFVVDNGSTSHTEQELAEACPNAQILRLSTNQGFAAAVNIGIREALKNRDLTHVLLLNNDTRCPPDALEQMLNIYAADERIGLVGCPMIEGLDTTNQRKVAAGKKLLRPFMIPISAPPDIVPDYLSGACLLIKRETLEEIGLLDEGFFFFFEDADFCRRAQNAGWMLSVCSATHIEHFGSSTIRHMGELEAYSYRAGHIRYLRKHSRHPLMSAMPAFLFRLAADAIKARGPALRGSWKGLRAGFEQPLPRPHPSTRTNSNSHPVRPPQS